MICRVLALVSFAWFTLSGCGPASQQPLPAPTASSNQSKTPPQPPVLTAPAPTKIPPDKPGHVGDDSQAFTFTVTEMAARRLRQILEGKPEGRRIAISVDFDDEKFCTGFHYNMKAESKISSDSLLMESQGIELAIDLTDAPYLKGTTLDYYDLGNGQGGFVFQNPNEKKVSGTDDERAQPAP